MKNAHPLSEMRLWHPVIHWSYFREWPHELDCPFPVEFSTAELSRDAFLPSTTIFSVHPSRCCSSLGLNDTFGGRLMQEAQSNESGEDTGCSLHLDETISLEWTASFFSRVFFLLLSVQKAQAFTRAMFIVLVEFHMHLTSILTLRYLCDKSRF